MVSAALIMAGVNFASGFLNGLSERKGYAHQAKEYDRQALLYRLNARRIREIGAIKEDAMRADNRQVMADFTTAAGEVGMGESPTTAKAAGTAATQLEQNVLNERYQTESEAENYLYEAQIAEANARAFRKKKRHAFAKNLLSATSSSLGNFA